MVFILKGSVWTTILGQYNIKYEPTRFLPGKLTNLVIQLTLHYFCDGFTECGSPMFEK